MGTFSTTDAFKTEFHFPLKLLELNKVIFMWVRFQTFLSMENYWGVAECPG